MNYGTIARHNGYVWAVQSAVKVERKNASATAGIDDILQVLDGQTITPGECRGRIKTGH